MVIVVIVVIVVILVIVVTVVIVVIVMALIVSWLQGTDRPTDNVSYWAVVDTKFLLPLKRIGVFGPK